MAAAGIAPVTLQAKEGLALINGTDGMLGMLVLALADLDVLVRTADIAAAMSVEALMATDRAFAADLMALRPHPGQTDVGRQPAPAARSQPDRRQPSHQRPARAGRLFAALHAAGARRGTRHHRLRPLVSPTPNCVSAIDNPSVLPDGRVESCGHFHGAPVGFACDFLAIAAAEVGAIAERRTDRMLDRTRSHGLPPFLAEDAGVNSGMMIAHYTQAAMVAENRRLAAPASVDSLPTSAMQEDHVSMGWGAARKLRRSVANLGADHRLRAGLRGTRHRARAVRSQPAAATAAAVAALRDAGVAGCRARSVAVAGARRRPRRW